MPLFKKRPIVVDAVQWMGPGHDVRGVYIWPGGDRLAYKCLTAQLKDVEPSPGDWIILESNQSLSTRLQSYPCKDDVFQATYRPLNWLDRLMRKFNLSREQS